ncbi:MAG: conjugal transfer pilus assembly protein TraF [Colwellia sp.]|jgi:conjugal transfer pilus assembly protein TraF
MRLLITLLCLFICFSVQVYAQVKTKQAPIKTHNINENLGWNFYWEHLDEEEIKPEINKTNEDSKPEIKPLKPLSTLWFKENFEVIRNRAVDNPTKENVQALLYAERVMLDKSESFARKKNFYQSVMPSLQEGSRLPMTGSAATAFRSFKGEQRREALQEIANHAGLVFFYDHDCVHCSGMIPLVNRLFRENKQKIYVIAKNLRGKTINRLDTDIDVYPDQGQSETFNIKVWPAIVMLRPPIDVLVVAQGSLYYSELEKRLINIAFETNILTDDWYYRVYPEQRGLISNNQLDGVPEDVQDDPVKLVNFIAELANNPEGSIVESASNGEIEK